MSSNPLADLLGKLLAEAGTDPEGIEVDIRHRGVPGDVRTISGTEFLRVGRQHLELDDGTHIPLHRIIAVRRSGVNLWSRT